MNLLKNATDKTPIRVHKHRLERHDKLALIMYYQSFHTLFHFISINK